MSSEIAKRTITFEPEAWIDANAYTQEKVGETLQEMSERSPLAAYAMVRYCIAAFAAAADEEAGYGNAIGPQFMQVLESYPETISEATEFDIRLFEIINDGGQPLERTRDRASETILKFTVEPPTQ